MCQVKELKEMRVKVLAVTNDNTVVASNVYSNEYLANKYGVDEIHEQINPDEIKTLSIVPDVPMDDTVFISTHACERLKERVGWKKKQQKRMIQRVYDQGKKLDDMTGYIKQWAIHQLRGVDEPLQYGDHMFLFNKKVLVTVFRIPNKTRCHEILAKKGV